MPGRPEQPERGLDLAAIEPGLRARAASALVSGSVALVLALAGPADAAPPLGLGDCGARAGRPPVLGPRADLGRRAARHHGHAPVAPAPRRLPLVVEIHGFGNSKYEYLDPALDAPTPTTRTAGRRRGYAVLTYTARGLWGSCGTPEARAANPAACARGYIHLADTRYEVRDTQELIGRLVDDGVADAGRASA